MYREIKFNVDIRGIRRVTGKYAMEHEALHEFAAAEHENMLFEYDNEREARTAYGWLKRNIEAEKKPHEAHVVKKSVLIVKTKREAK